MDEGRERERQEERMRGKLKDLYKNQEEDGHEWAADNAEKELEDYSDENLYYMEYIEGFFCQLSKQKDALEQWEGQQPFSKSALKRYHVTPAIDSPEPAPHTWREFRKNKPKLERMKRDEVIQQFEAKVVAWKEKKKERLEEDERKASEEYLQQEMAFMDNSAIDKRIQYSELRGWKRHEYSDKEIWDTVTRHGQTPTCEDVIELQGTTHVQMYTLGMNEVVDYRENIRPIEDELNLQGVFSNWCPENYQVIFHGKEKKFSNHDPLLYDLEALGRLRWPEEEEGEEGLSGETVEQQQQQQQAAAAASGPGQKGRGRKKTKDAQPADGLESMVDSFDETLVGDGILVENTSNVVVSNSLDQINVDSSGTIDPFSLSDTQQGSEGDAYDDDTYISDDATDNEDNMNYDQNTIIINPDQEDDFMF
jgi:hypothetical protein